MPDQRSTQSSGEPKRVIDFPDAWATGKPIDQMFMSNPSGTITIGTILLDDGSGLWALVFKGGHRFARTAACTGWAIEERFDGDPEPDEAEEVNSTWRDVLQQMIRAGREVDEMIGLRPRADG